MSPGDHQRRSGRLITTAMDTRQRSAKGDNYEIRRVLTRIRCYCFTGAVLTHRCRSASITDHLLRHRPNTDSGCDKLSQATCRQFDRLEAHVLPANLTPAFPIARDRGVSPALGDSVCAEPLQIVRLNCPTGKCLFQAVVSVPSDSIPASYYALPVSQSATATITPDSRQQRRVCMLDNPDRGHQSSGNHH